MFHHLLIQHVSVVLKPCFILAVSVGAVIVTDIIEKFFDLEKQVWALAGASDVHYKGLDDCTQYSFYLDDTEAVYGIPRTQDYWGGGVYGTAIFRGEKYTIAVINDGCGNHKCPLLFDNSKAVDTGVFGNDAD